MTWLVLVLVLVGAAVMQTVLPGYALLGQTKFPFLLAVVLYYALNWNTTGMMVAAFLAGFLQDSLSPIPLGYSAFCFCVAGWIAGRFRKVVLTDSVVTQIFFGAAAGAGVSLRLYILRAKDALVSCSPQRVVLRTLTSGMLGMVCTPVACFAAGWLDRVVGNVELEETLDGTA